MIAAVTSLVAVASACQATAPAAQPSDSSGADGQQTPRTVFDYTRTCSDGEGFPGVAAYSATKSTLHPAVLVEKTSAGWGPFGYKMSELPPGWMIGPRDDFTKAELVVCLEQVDRTAAGMTCAMENSETHNHFSIAIYNTRFRIRVIEARTGKTLLDQVRQAKFTECPAVLLDTSGPDPTSYDVPAEPANYQDIIRPFIAP
jgi:hypothetical protein